MKTNTAEQLQECISDHIQKEKERQEEIKTLSQKSILRIIERVTGLSYQTRKQIEEINQLEVLTAILGEIWNVKDSKKVQATINKYEWLVEMKKLEGEELSL